MTQPEHERTEVIQRATFRSSLDDLVDVHLRFVGRSGVTRRARRFEAAMLGLVVGVATFAALSVWTDASLSFRIVFVAMWTAIWVAINVFASRAILRRRLRRYLQEQYGSEDTECEIELRPLGARVRQRNTEVILDWQNAESVEDTAGGIEIRFRGGLVVARDRAFATPAERQAFLDAARTLSARAG